MMLEADDKGKGHFRKYPLSEKPLSDLSNVFRSIMKGICEIAALAQ